MTVKISPSRILVPFSYLLMVTVNALANILPINGLNTGAVSDSYPNLFAPAGFTFSIWGLIYLLLGAYSVYQFFPPKSNKLLSTLNPLFIASCIVNSAWIFAWHYLQIGLTVILMLALLIILIRIANLFYQNKLNFSEKIFLKLPFGIYFGWITVATIANITAFLVSSGWNGFGLPETFWMNLVLFVGVGIAAWRMHHDSNLGYGLVPVWAYFGIWSKHTSVTGFNNAYPSVITVVLVCLFLLLLSNILLVAKKKML